MNGYRQRGPENSEREIWRKNSGLENFLPRKNSGLEHFLPGLQLGAVICSPEASVKLTVSPAPTPLSGKSQKAPGGRERPGRSGREPARAQTLLKVPRPLPSPFPSSALSFAADFSCLGLAQRGCYVAGRGRGGDPRPRWGENSCPRKPEGALGGWVAGRSRGLGASRQADSWLGTRTRRRGSGIYVVYEPRPQLLAPRPPPPRPLGRFKLPSLRPFAPVARAA